MRERIKASGCLERMPSSASLSRSCGAQLLRLLHFRLHESRIMLCAPMQENFCPYRISVLWSPEDSFLALRGWDVSCTLSEFQHVRITTVLLTTLPSDPSRPLCLQLKSEDTFLVGFEIVFASLRTWFLSAMQVESMRPRSFPFPLLTISGTFVLSQKLPKHETPDLADACIIVACLICARLDSNITGITNRILGNRIAFHANPSWHIPTKKITCTPSR